MRENSSKLSIIIISFILGFISLVSAGDVIQTQESTTYDGLEVDLTGLKVKDNIITVKFKFRSFHVKYRCSDYIRWH